MRLAHVNDVVDVSRRRRRRRALKIAGVTALALSSFAFGFVTDHLARPTTFAELPDAMPLGVIHTGQPLPWWAATKSDHAVAGIDFVGVLQDDQVWLKPLAGLMNSNCGDYLDAFDPSPENAYVPCPSAILVSPGSGVINGINLDLRNFYGVGIEFHASGDR